MVKKWLANIIEGVYYLHQLGIVHRNLKPGSLYIQNSSTASSSGISLLIGDYSVLTITKDTSTKTRIASGAYDYTAPEVFDAQTFDSKSDIWSIGTILLDICTTSLYDVINRGNVKQKGYGVSQKPQNIT